MPCRAIGRNPWAASAGRSAAASPARCLRHSPSGYLGAAGNGRRERRTVGPGPRCGLQHVSRGGDPGRHISPPAPEQTNAVSGHRSEYPRHTQRRQNSGSLSGSTPAIMATANRPTTILNGAAVPRPPGARPPGRGRRGSVAPRCRPRRSFSWSGRAGRASEPPSGGCRNRGCSRRSRRRFSGP